MVFRAVAAHLRGGSLSVAEIMMSRFTGMMPTLAAAAVLAAGIAGCTDAVGYYRPAAEAECRTRGIDPQGPAFAACVKAVEDAEYRRWSKGLPGH